MLGSHLDPLLATTKGARKIAMFLIIISFIIGYLVTHV